MKLFNFQKRNIEEPQQVANDVILSALLSDETITERLTIKSQWPKIKKFGLVRNQKEGEQKERQEARKKLT